NVRKQADGAGRGRQDRLGPHVEAGQNGIQNGVEYRIDFLPGTEIVSSLKDLIIRKMEPGDIDAIPLVFASWNKFRPQYEKYFEENNAGKRVTLVAEVNDKVAGYANVLWTSKFSPFSDAGIPEINDPTRIGGAPE